MYCLPQQGSIAYLAETVTSNEKDRLGAVSDRANPSEQGSMAKAGC